MATRFDGSTIATVSVDPAMFERHQLVLGSQRDRGQLQDVRTDLETHGVDDRQPVFLLQVDDELVLGQKPEPYQMRRENTALMLLLGGRFGQLILGDQRSLDGVVHRVGTSA